ncbi:PBSX family phage terminase large subunit [Burkholderia cenocepacia]|uniref:PBSX family phage terminase large subunit n=1 Tax=Burkholderia cenocepacia TaxID=95486 RepID=UPI0013E0C307|nr:PBSX family phage terminase large subunit [Burkholderia cenocepacia]MCW3581729.1 PBSX family phage terminase large subunit [Burkholderia cenocepacia]MCW3626697.1 PBSX family phage terminase large subunit [Burkholderia cenocepacia]MCW3641934.1 PBSX family phage terminase large subunit [Burkholderia cenocepacia]
MSRRRLSHAAITRVESYFSGVATDERPAVFGIVDMDRNVIKRLTVDGEETDAEPTVLIAQKLERLIYPKRWKIVLGGRGSMKTRTIVSILTARSQARRERALCLREIQASIDESSYQEIAEEIERRELGDSFRQLKKSIRVPANGSSFSFRGLFRNQRALKGFTAATVAWVDEAENVSRDSWDILAPTIRAPGSEIWVSFNPNRESDPTWADHVAPYADQMVDGVYEDDERLIIRCNWSDNPWFPEELELERQRMLRTDMDRYNWIWEGKFNRRSDELIFSGKYQVDTFETPANARFFFGADWGFSQDPTTLNRCWVRGNDLMIDWEAHGKQVDLDDIWKLFAGREGMRPEQVAKWKAGDEKKYPGIPGARKWKIKADCSRPETISHVAKQGFNIDAAKKWGGSVEDGIAFLRGFDRIIIHSRCVKTKEEFDNYSYKVDKTTGDVLPIIVDKWNHHIDGIRYSMDGYIRGRGNGLNISAEALAALAIA